MLEFDEVFLVSVISIIIVEGKLANKIKIIKITFDVNSYISIYINT